jgi:hypothetical protein
MFQCGGDVVVLVDFNCSQRACERPGRFQSSE